MSITEINLNDPNRVRKVHFNEDEVEFLTAASADRVQMYNESESIPHSYTPLERVKLSIGENNLQLGTIGLLRRAAKNANWVSYRGTKLHLEGRVSILVTKLTKLANGVAGW